MPPTRRRESPGKTLWRCWPESLYLGPESNHEACIPLSGGLASAGQGCRSPDNAECLTGLFMGFGSLGVLYGPATGAFSIEQADKAADADDLACWVEDVLGVGGNQPNAPRAVAPIQVYYADGQPGVEAGHIAAVHSRIDAAHASLFSSTHQVLARRLAASAWLESAVAKQVPDNGLHFFWAIHGGLGSFGKPPIEVG